MILGVITTYAAEQSQVGYSVGFSVPAASGRARVTSSKGDLSVRAGTGHRIVVHGHLSSSFTRPRFTYSSTAAGWRSIPSAGSPPEPARSNSVLPSRPDCRSASAMRSANCTPAGCMGRSR